jgi:membrane-bound lytic murein transglycosylase D
MLEIRIIQNLIVILMVSILLAILPMTAKAKGNLENNNTSGIIRASTNSNKQLDDLWARIRNGFSLADMRSQEVRHNESQYTRQQKYIDHIVERSRRYLFYIVEEVERRGMPTEIALLPIVESAFDPIAYSRQHASGLWQFIPSTGRAYGLEQNWWHDERRDVVAATQAALDYLQKLHKMFGDWKLTLAAYNWGEGSLKKTIDENHNGSQRIHFRDLQLPLETKNHVAKLIAVRNIIANPESLASSLNRCLIDLISSRWKSINLSMSNWPLSWQGFQKMNSQRLIRPTIDRLSELMNRHARCYCLLIRRKLL